MIAAAAMGLPARESLVLSGRPLHIAAQAMELAPSPGRLSAQTSGQVPTGCSASPHPLAWHSWLLCRGCLQARQMMWSCHRLQLPQQPSAETGPLACWHPILMVSRSCCSDHCSVQQLPQSPSLTMLGAQRAATELCLTWPPVLQPLLRSVLMTTTAGVASPTTRRGGPLTFGASFWPLGAREHQCLKAAVALCRRPAAASAVQYHQFLPPLQIQAMAA